MYKRVWAEIDLKALKNNVRVIREKIGPDVRMMAVVKSDAYGHGADVVIPALLDMGVDAFAVACVERGVQAREIIRKTRAQDPDNKYLILVLGYADPEEYPDAIEHHIDVALYTLEQAKALSAAALRMKQTAEAQIKVETGMNRIGFPDNEKAADQIAEAAALPGIHLRGAFTHFARCDEKDKVHAKAQQRRFDQMIETLAAKGVNFELLHSANSAAIMEYPEALTTPCQHGAVKGDSSCRIMARAGIMLYGLYPSNEMDPEKTSLEPVMSLKTHIVHLKEVEAGEAIGYGGSYVAMVPRLVATVPIGYGDGYPRALSNKGYMLVNGVKAPILGRVCMDQTMIDVTDVPHVQLMDEVTVFGHGLPVDELADLCQTIHYEILCQLTSRVKREPLE